MKLRRDENIYETDNIFINLLLVWPCNSRHIAMLTGQSNWDMVYLKNTHQNFAYIYLLRILKCP